jgi:hypothetical protein
MTGVFDTYFATNYDVVNYKWKIDQVTLAKYVGLLARSDSAIVTDLAAELTLINTDYASGAGTYAGQGESLEGIGLQVYSNNQELVNGTYGLNAILTQGNAAWITATGFSTHSAADVVTALGTGSSLTDLATQTSVNTIDDFLDTEIAAIKAKTDLIENLYTAQIDFQKDAANTRDEYSVTWLKNGIPQASGITSPTVQVVKRDATNLINRHDQQRQRRIDIQRSYEPRNRWREL